MMIFTRNFLLIFLLSLGALSTRAQTAIFTTSATTGCAPLPISFTNSSTGATSYRWNFGNGDFSTLPIPGTESYSTPGTYTITLTAYAGVDSSSTSVVITVPPPMPDPSFSVSDTFFCSGAMVTFNNTTSGVPSGTTYTWTFGDGASSGASSPTHIYPANTTGYQLVSLTAYSSLGCPSATVSETIHIDSLIKDTFTVNKYYFCRNPAHAIFNGHLSSGGTRPFSYHWDFGDSSAPFVTASDTISHNYTDTGRYTITLGITDARGCTVSFDTSITVSGRYASFTANSGFCLYTTDTFTNTSFTIAPTNSYKWLFGNGDSSLLTNPVYTYTVPGTYAVTLLANNGKSCRDTAVDSITVWAEPAVNFTTSPAAPCPAPTDITFTSTAPSGYTELWSFGDGSTGSGNPVTHTYTASSLDTLVSIWGTTVMTYKLDTVTLVTTDLHGCIDTLSKVDTIHDMYSLIQQSVPGGCAPVAISFSVTHNTSVPYSITAYPYAITSYLWDFGDGSLPSSDSAPSHTYTTAATDSYTVRCTMTTANGCTIVDTTKVSIGTTSSLTLSETFTHVCVGQADSFTAVITAGAINYTAWYWGDGTGEINTTGVDVYYGSHAYTHPGTYTVAAYGYNNGCYGTPELVHVIVDSPSAVIGYSYNCSPANAVTFRNNSVGVSSFLWTLSDGTTSTADSFSHTFPLPSLDTAKLTTYNTASGCSTSVRVPLRIFQLTPSFTGDDTAICRDMAVTFSGSVTGGAPIGPYTWYIDSSATACDTPGLTKVFSSTGIYSVSFVVYDSTHNCSDTFTRNNYIIVAKPADHFTVTPTDGCNPLTVIFADSSTDVTGATIASYTWKFGDGSSPITCVCPTTTHTYTLSTGVTSLNFSDTSIVVDNIGCRDTLVLPHSDTVIRVKANFSTSINVCLGNLDTFSNTSTFAFSDGHTFLWSFGDGTTSTLTSPVHLYADTGTYHDTLWATDTVHGCTSLITKTVHVTKPIASFSITNPAILCTPVVDTFTSTSWPATGLSYSWTYYHGPSSYAAASTTYDASFHGTDTVRLIVTNAYGCTDTALGVVSVFGYAGDFSYTTSGCSPLTVHFSTLAFAGADSATWLFGDGHSVTAAGDSFTYVYAHPGAYVPTLVLGHTVACHVASTGADTIKVDSASVSFTAEPNPICPHLDVTFTGTGHSLYSAITQYEYLFDGTDSTNVNPALYSYAISGSYPVTLTVTDGWGCHATSTDTVTISPIPGTITGTDSICVGSSTLFTDTTAGGIWTSDNTSIATVGSTGLVTGVAAGNTTITYVVTNVWGCTATNTHTIHVHGLPDAGTIGGQDSVCLGSMTTMTETLTSGSWSSSNPLIASIDASGVVTGISLGTVTLSYTVYDGFCYNYALFTFQVVTVPAVPAITGIDSACVGGTTYLSDSWPGGYWYSYDPSVADVDPVTGTVTGYAVGATVIAYDVTNDCGMTEVTVPMVVIPLDPPITGVFSVCSGSATPLSNIIAGGIWSSSDSTIASVDPVTGVVTGVSTGSATITYTGTSVCGAYTETALVSVNTQPFITTNFIVACQSLAPGKGGTTLISGIAGCIQVCDSTVMRYYANGVDSSAFTWSVFGGIMVANYGDSIDVFWPSAGTVGSITLTDTFSHCINSATACIQVIQKPHALFTASAMTVCLNGSVVFSNLSTGDLLSPIVSYYWNFGDGSGSAEINPTHIFTSYNQTDTVMLVVKNACNCSDTFRVVINVEKSEGAVITCPSVLCDSQTATYAITDDGCSPSYAWSVTGGTITAGAGTPSITVNWNAVPASGFGTVSVIDPCSGCPDGTSTVQIPVILANATIMGPDTICAGEQFEYTLPLWPATRYMWGTLGDSTVRVGPKDDYKLVVDYHTAGLDTLHAWYQNQLGMCGGNVYKHIVVQPATPIDGPVNACLNDPATYSIGGGYSGSWTLSDYTGAVVATGTGVTFNYTFTTYGTYQLSVTGAFCADPITINVNPSPAPIDGVTGTDTVCMHRVYAYLAYNDVPGTIYNWQAIGGTVTPPSGSGSVNAIWTAGTGMELIVYRTNTAFPYCSSLPDTIKIVQDSIKLQMTGDTLPCANGHRTYSTAYTHGEAYNWSIYPATAGSVTTGDHTPSVDVLWNHVTGAVPLNAMVILTVHRCDTVIFDTLKVKIKPTPVVYITVSPNPTCPGIPVTMSATSGAGSYVWDFGDGTGMVTTTANTTTHAFPTNLTTGIVSYEVKVVAMAAANYCPVSGSATKLEDVLPGPIAYASAAVTSLCMSDPLELVGTVTNNAGPLTYAWYGPSGPFISVLGTLPTYYTTTPGNFYFKVTAANGCYALSNSIRVDTCGNNNSDTCHIPVSATSTVNCGTINLTGSSSGGPTSMQWAAVTPPVTPLASGPTAVATYNDPGIYRFSYTEYFGTCANNAEVLDTIPLIPRFLTEIQCAAGGNDSVFLEDNSAYLPFYGIVNIDWYISPGGIHFSAIPGRHISLPAPGTYTITEVVSYAKTPPPSLVSSCAVTHTVVLPGTPHATFTDSTSPICSTVPIQFTPTSPAGLAHYYWTFGDASACILPNPEKAYTWVSPDPATFNRTVTLTVTDTIGCTADSSLTVQIMENQLAGKVVGDSIVCSKDAPVTLGFNNIGIFTPITYLWSTGATSDTISVDTSGAYWVTVFGQYQCQLTTFPAHQVDIIKVPDNSITGHTVYCQGDSVRLSSNAGMGYSYHWFRGATAIGTASSIADGGLPAGTYYYHLVLQSLDTTGGIACIDTATDTVSIYAQPAPPTVTGPDVITCTPYNVSLTASEPEPGTYNWSDGTMGAIDNSIYTGGLYKVWFTNINGCQSSTVVNVPMSPEFYLQYFPTGCYTLCSNDMPIVLYGPPDVVFHKWGWWDDSTDVESGVDTQMASYNVIGSGDYNWTLSNSLCDAQSGNMDLNVEKCTACGNATFSATITCTSGDPASYHVHIKINGVTAPATFELGTDLGPIDAFSGSLVGTAPFILDLTYTSIVVPNPGAVTVKLLLTYPNGSKCFLKNVENVATNCNWEEERITDTTTSNDGGIQPASSMSSAMLVYPNPASGLVNISYSYGTDAYTQRYLVVYDEMGRKIDQTAPTDEHGQWTVNTESWAQGIYIIRMEADGKALQTQKIVVTH